MVLYCQSHHVIVAASKQASCLIPVHNRQRTSTGPSVSCSHPKWNCSELLLLNPDPVYTHYYLGLIRERQGDAAQAAVHFKEALARVLPARPM